MQRALIVVDPIDPAEQFIAEAGEIAQACGAEMVLLHVTTEDEYDETRRAIDEIGASEGGAYNVSQAESGARQLAQDVGREVFGDGTEFESVGAVGDTSTRVLEAARELECDHIFIAGRKRSPSGKAIFGDAAQRVILNSDVPVTVTTYES